MRTIQRVTTLLTLALTVAGAQPIAQAPDNPARTRAAREEMQKGDALAQQRHYEAALQSYKKAFTLSGKTSLPACVGIAVAYRELGAHKNVAEACLDAMKLTDDTRQLASLHNMRGAALAALSDTPDDKRLLEAEREFRAALAANENLIDAHQNLGVTLLKMKRDDEGVRALKRYVEIAPKGQERDAALKIIDEPWRARAVRAPAFSFTSRQGEFISLADLKGKTVVLDFWGTWCKPCLMATPDLLELNHKYSEQGVVFISVAVEHSGEKPWAAYIDKSGMSWPQFLDKTSTMVTPFGVFTYPTYIVIDGEGLLRARDSGYAPAHTKDWIENQIKQTFKSKGTW